MAEPQLSLEELDRVGLPHIDVHWPNEQKMEAMFKHFKDMKEPLPSHTVNADGVAEPNKSLLARLAKIKSGKQVFKADYAIKLLKKALRNVGVVDPTKKNGDETSAEVREGMQNTVDKARRERSDADKKLGEALDKVELLKAENRDHQETIKKLKQELNAVNEKLRVEKKRVLEIHELEQIEFRRA